jgi:hypothetical protein
MIAGQVETLVFPKKEKPVNLFVTPKQIGHFDTFPPMLSGYQPAFYVEQAEEVAVLQDERMRDRFLVKKINQYMQHPTPTLPFGANLYTQVLQRKGNEKHKKKLANMHAL